MEDVVGAHAAVARDGFLVGCFGALAAVGGGGGVGGRGGG